MRVSGWWEGDGGGEERTYDSAWTTKLTRFSTSSFGKGPNLDVDELSVSRVTRGKGGSEPETSTTGLNSGDDLVDIVADNAESNVLCELFDD